MSINTRCGPAFKALMCLLPLNLAITVQGYTMVISAPRTSALTEQNSLDTTNEPTTSVVGVVYVYKYNGIT